MSTRARHLFREHCPAIPEPMAHLRMAAGECIAAKSWGSVGREIRIPRLGFGLLAAVQSFGNLVASAIAGLIWTVLSPEAAFAYIAGWMLVALSGLATSR